MNKKENTCSRCGCKFRGDYKHVMGPVLGKMLTYQHVCPGCHDDHHDIFGEQFWQGTTAQPNMNCAKCGDSLIDQKVGGLVPGPLQEDGSYSCVVICAKCHDLFVALCQQVSKRK